MNASVTCGKSEARAYGLPPHFNEDREILQDRAGPSSAYPMILVAALQHYGAKPQVVVMNRPQFPLMLAQCPLAPLFSPPLTLA